MKKKTDTKLDREDEKPAPKLQLMFADEVAAECGANIQTIYARARRGELPGIKVGKKWVFSVLALKRRFDGEFGPRVMQGDQPKEDKTCRSTDLEKAQTIITNSTVQKLEKYYKEALAPRTRRKRKNSTTA